MYSTFDDMSWFYVNPFWTKICAKNDIFLFVPSNLDLWALHLKFALPVTLFQRYVCTKLDLEVSTGFLEKIGSTERTDSRT